MTTRDSLRALPVALATAALALGLAACGSDDDSSSDAKTATTTAAAPAAAIVKNTSNGATTLTIGSKNFTEQKVLGEVYAQALAAAGYKVKTALNLGDETTALKAVKSGQISGYPEYTGTALGSLLKVPADKLTHDPVVAYSQVKSGLAKEGVSALEPTPFTSSNEVAVTPETAAKYNLKNISDLGPVADKLKLYGSPECRKRIDCLLGLQQVYGLKFGSFTPVDVAQRHPVLENGDADVSIVFTTDPENKRDKLVLLKDDKGMFPPYNSTFLLKSTTADKAGPDLTTTIAKVNKNLTAPVVQELNARVDLDKETPKQAAAAYLKQYGFTQ